MKHLIKPIQKNKLALITVESDEGPKKLGKFPDFITKGLEKPSLIGGKIKGAIALGKILYKTGAYKRVARYYGYKNRYRITAGVGGGLIVGSLLSIPFSGPFGQTRTNMVQSRARRIGYKNRNIQQCCPAHC